MTYHGVVTIEGLPGETAPPARGTFEARHPLKGERYWSREAPAGAWDAIVVGSGMGGLTTAANLARLGRRVLVLEQHYLPGGFTHAFSHRGYVWDVGVHVVGEVTKHTLTGRLVDALTGGRLTWASLGSTYEEFFFPDGLHIEFPDDPGAFRARLVEAFPAEEAAIDRYFALVRRAVAAQAPRFLARALPAGAGAVAESLLARRARRDLRRTVEAVLEELTADRRLRAVLTAQWGYYGVPPSRAAFAMQAIVTRHYLHGGYYPVGGAQEIGRALTRTVAEAGGWTRIAADVETVVIESGRAVGVRLRGGETLRAPRVFLATGVGTAVRHLLPEPERSAAWARALAALEPGPAHVCLYLGFRGDPRGAGASTANRWFYGTYEAESALWQVEAGREPGAAPVLYLSFPSLKDPVHDPGAEQRHTGELVTFVPWSAFERWSGSHWHERGEDYESFKRALSARLLAQLYERMPALEPLVEVAELSTPVSTEFFCRPLAGSIYGLAPTPERFASRWLRPRTPIRGLFFSGSDMASGGVMGALGGGLLAAFSAEPWGTSGLLRGLKS
jgi:all-trans-retinol 13,14-reductase